MSLSLVACGGGKEDAKSGNEGGKDMPAEGLKGSISVQAETAWMPYYEAAIARLKEKNPDAEVKIIEKGAFDHLDALDQTSPENEDIADVFSIPADRLYGLVDNENLAAIDAESIVKTVGGWADFAAFNKGLGGNFKIGEEYFAFPMNIECLIAFKQKANAEAQGIDLTKPIAIGAETAKSVLVPAHDAWYGVALLNAGGIELLAKKDDGSLYSDLTAEWAELPAEKQAVIQALYDYWKANADANTSLFEDKAGYAYTDSAFKTGESGVVRLGGPWDYDTIAKMAGEENLELGSLEDITIAGKPLVHWKGGWGYAINVRDEGNEDKMALAQALIAELANPEYFEDFFKATGKIMEQVPADKYEASGLTDVEKSTIVNVIASYQNAVSRPLFTEYGKVWDSWKNAVLSWNSVKPGSAEEAYKELKSSFDSMMSNFNK
uniref:sugar ABC transporter substrate-binding protein n=1 Tax=Ndongobacter massiliensis TaxID=1871025 RepID=UPI00093099F8|nr:sugar ABC transporter substrate-binding protein [Ndongobacter massiliensis]